MGGRGRGEEARVGAQRREVDLRNRRGKELMGSEDEKDESLTTNDRFCTCTFRQRLLRLEPCPFSSLFVQVSF